MGIEPETPTNRTIQPVAGRLSTPLANTRVTSVALTALALMALVVSAPLHASAQAPTVTDDTNSCAIQATAIAGGLEFPWAVAFLDDQTALISERPGAMQLVNLTDGTMQQVSGVPDVVDQRQGGLLDLALAPDFEASGTLFFAFSEPRSGGTGTSIARATLHDWQTSAPTLSNVDVIFQQSDPDGSGFHFGSRIVVLPDGTLAFTIGDRGTPERAQDPEDHAGSVLRINQDGSIPADNPFTEPGGNQPHIWSIGHRNPQGAALDPATGQLWTVEHGARGGDEINRPEAGLNYGWPTISYGVNYSGTPIGVGTEAPGLEQPVYFWDPSIAPSGMAIVHDSPLFPSWQGDMLVGALRDQVMVRLIRQGETIIMEERYFEEALGRIRDVRQGPDGALWLLTDDPDGALLRVTPVEGVC